MRSVQERFRRFCTGAYFLSAMFLEDKNVVRMKKVLFECIRRKVVYFMRFQGIVFDFDYTLGDSTNGIVLSVNNALERMGYPVAALEEIRKTIGLSLCETYYALTKDKDTERAQLFSIYFKEMADKVMVQNTVVYADAAVILKELKKRSVKTGIVTTKYHYRIEQILEKYQLQNEIDEIVGAEDVSIEKPDPEGLLKIVQKLGLERMDVLYVGDSLVDARTASRASVAFAGVLTGTTTYKDFLDYEHLIILTNVGELNKTYFHKNPFV